jgi:hypothetical protein
MHAARQRPRQQRSQKSISIIHFYTPAYFLARSASLDLIASAVLQAMGSDWSQLCKVPYRAVASGQACSLPPQRALSLRNTSTRRLWQRSACCLCRFMKLRERNGGMGGGGGEGGVCQGGFPSHFHSGFACKCRCHAAACDGVRKVSCIANFPLFYARALRCTATSMQCTLIPLMPHLLALLSLLLQRSLCASSALDSYHGVYATVMRVYNNYQASELAAALVS